VYKPRLVAAKGLYEGVQGVVKQVRDLLALVGAEAPYLHEIEQRHPLGSA
jgi:hypothetical protein